MADTDRDWQIWGEKDPYFGVLSDPKYRGTSIGQTRNEFMAEGEAYVERHLADVERQLGLVNRARAFDFGCGVGRLAIPLGHRFTEVVGLDIVPGMLAEAEANVRRLGLSNVHFAMSDDTLTNAPGPYDFVHTYIVMQHIPVARGLPIIRQLLRRVREGGAISLHVNLERRMPLSHKVLYWARMRVPGANAAVNLMRGRSVGEPCMQMNEYSLPDVVDEMALAGFPEVVVRHEDHGLCHTAQLIARKIGGS